MKLKPALKHGLSLVVVIITSFLRLDQDIAYGQSYSDDYIRKQISEILTELHPSDSRDWWRALGPTTPRIVMEMFAETSRPLYKEKLINALSWFDGPEVKAFLLQNARNSASTAIRIQAVRAYGFSQGGAGLAELEEFLEHKESQTRLTAARALQRLAQEGLNKPDNRAKAILEAYLQKEPARWIRMSLEKTPPVLQAGDLRQVSSSEDKIRPELSGLWQGYWLEPQSGGKKPWAMQSLPTEMMLSIPEKGLPTAILKTTEIQSEWQWDSVVWDEKKDSKTLRGKFKLVKSKDSHFGQRLTSTFFATFSYRAGHHRLQIEIPDWSATLILKKVQVTP